jgi:hypothetical protein
VESNYSSVALSSVLQSPTGGLALAMVAAHLIGDFVAQTDAMVASKRKPTVLLAHAAIHGGLAYVAVGIWHAWTLPLAVMLIHSAIDCGKLLYDRGAARPSLPAFVADQGAHVASIAALALIFVRIGGPCAWQLMFGNRVLCLFVLLSGAILCVQSASVMIGLRVQAYLDQMKGNESRGLENGGRTKGQWERGLIFLFVMVNMPSAVGFLVTAKSIFRFGELTNSHNRKEAEYITIGTLMSFGIAFAVSLATRFVITRLYRP